MEQTGLQGQVLLRRLQLLGRGGRQGSREAVEVLQRQVLRCLPLLQGGQLGQAPAKEWGGYGSKEGCEEAGHAGETRICGQDVQARPGVGEREGDRGKGGQQGAARPGRATVCESPTRVCE